VINVDDEYGARLAADLQHSDLAPPITFALDRDATYRAHDVHTGLHGSQFTIIGPEGAFELSSPLRGRFNVYNALGAFAVARALAVSADTVIEALDGADLVPGRFEPVEEGQDFAVLVDYAHTPDSLENVLRAARELATGRLHVVFGCGGDRDRGKRPLMGEIAVRLADRVIVTSDNPRSEDPDAIIQQILAGCGSGVEHNVDRREAIGQAIAGAGSGDVMVIAGKGHEQGQEFEHGRKIPFDDATVAREVLRAAALAR
jgi:UDP-N-acetylmuramoyl-L-alanyl-D-glutamate--2,6-diaminopimelate ligase